MVFKGQMESHFTDNNPMGDIFIMPDFMFEALDFS